MWVSFSLVRKTLSWIIFRALFRAPNHQIFEQDPTGKPLNPALNNPTQEILLTAVSSTCKLNWRTGVNLIKTLVLFFPLQLPSYLLN